MQELKSDLRRILTDERDSSQAWQDLYSKIYSQKAKVLFILEFAFSLCRGENEKWVEPVLISFLGLCFGGNRQRLLSHFRRLKHEPIR